MYAQAGFDQYGYECENDLSLLVDDSQVDTLTSLEQLQLLVEVCYGYLVIIVVVIIFFGVKAKQNVKQWLQRLFIC